MSKSITAILIGATMIQANASSPRLYPECTELAYSPSFANNDTAEYWVEGPSRVSADKGFLTYTQSEGGSSLFFRKKIELYENDTRLVSCVDEDGAHTGGYLGLRAAMVREHHVKALFRNMKVWQRRSAPTSFRPAWRSIRSEA